MRRERLLTLLVPILAVGFAMAAAADVVRPIGPIAGIRIQSASSDVSPSFDGFIMVGDSIGGYARYNWGGSWCAGLNLSDEEIEILQRGMSNPRILIEPFTKTGQGGLCLVAFSLVLRSDQAALP